MIITGTRMRRLCLTEKKGREMMKIGRYRKGGGRVGGEGWIDGKDVGGIDLKMGGLYICRHGGIV